jgi:hypothetical protein
VQVSHLSALTFSSLSTASRVAISAATWALAVCPHRHIVGVRPLIHRLQVLHAHFEVAKWMPGRNEYGEISSMSMCTDYQARRLNIRHNNQTKNDGTQFVHTLNGTACAVPRLLIALLETYQQPDGSVVIPEVLRPYMGDQEIIQARSN